jgi:hypothetical protein
MEASIIEFKVMDSETDPKAVGGGGGVVLQQEVHNEEMNVDNTGALED